MDNTGPLLETLTRRLLETPPEFLAEPRLGPGIGTTAGAGSLAVAALVNDVLLRHGARAPAAFLRRLQGDGAAGERGERNRLSLVAIAAWLLADDWFAGAGLAQDAVCRMLIEAPAELAQATAARKFVDDADRREELARVVLYRLGYRPQGETPAQASDRLSAISGVERRRLLEASRAAEKRAREIREALAAKAAQESADKWTRE